MHVHIYYYIYTHVYTHSLSFCSSSLTYSLSLSHTHTHHLFIKCFGQKTRLFCCLLCELLFGIFDICFALSILTHINTHTNTYTNKRTCTYIHVQTSAWVPDFIVNVHALLYCATSIPWPYNDAPFHLPTLYFRVAKSSLRLLRGSQGVPLLLRVHSLCLCEPLFKQRCQQQCQQQKRHEHSSKTSGLLWKQSSSVQYIWTSNVFELNETILFVNTRPQSEADSKFLSMIDGEEETER